jgi:hypothetical protein
MRRVLLPMRREVLLLLPRERSCMLLMLLLRVALVPCLGRSLPGDAGDWPLLPHPGRGKRSWPILRHSMCMKSLCGWRMEACIRLRRKDRPLGILTLDDVGELLCAHEKVLERIVLRPRPFVPVR